MDLQQHIHFIIVITNIIIIIIIIVWAERGGFLDYKKKLKICLSSVENIMLIVPY